MPNKPSIVTFTGLDKKSLENDTDKIISLSQKYPVEWGILASLTNEKNKFSSFRLKNGLNYLAMSGVNFSVHLCETLAQEAKKGIHLSDFNKEVVNKDFHPHYIFQRVQINSVKYENAASIDLFQTKVKVPVILQWRGEETFPYEENDCVQYLYDCSGGKGVEINQYPFPATDDQFVGYSGGISEDNVLDVISKIPAKKYWIDMETSLRNKQDWFDIDVCERILKKIYEDN